jgi:hypothetical protein
MEEPKHTPGPWIWAERNQGLYGAGPDNAVLQFYSYEGMHLSGRTEDVQEANARLIAAAPDLLQMLKVAQMWLELDGRFDMQVINAAIAKASLPNPPST